MNENKISYLIEKSLENYDNQNEKYKKYINNKKIILNSDNFEITFNSNNNKKEIYNYEILGIFDNQTFVWIWSWMFPLFNIQQTSISKDLLQYGLKLEPVNDNDINNLFLKVQFVNSRFLLQDFLQLEIHLALSSYLSKNKFKFIYPKKNYLDKEKTKYIIIYYLIL